MVSWRESLTFPPIDGKGVGLFSRRLTLSRKLLAVQRRTVAARRIMPSVRRGGVRVGGELIFG